MLKKYFGKKKLKEKKYGKRKVEDLQDSERVEIISKESIYVKLFELAPNFESKYVDHSSPLFWLNKIFMFANETGGTHDYEQAHGKLSGLNNNANIFIKMAKHFEGLAIEPYYEHEKNREENIALKENEWFYLHFDYRWFNASNLYCYFAWRTALRKVLVEDFESLPDDNREVLFLNKVSNDLYLYLYILELINQIGIKNPEEGYEIIHKHLRQLFGNIDNAKWYPEIEKNYALYYGLDDGTAYSKKIDNVITALKKQEIAKFIDICKERSSYDYLQSSFYSSEHGYLLFEVLPYVMNGIITYMEGKEIDFENLIVGKFIVRHWKPFSKFNFLDRDNAQPICHISSEYEESYSYLSGQWIEQIWWYHTTYTGAIIGYIIKVTEKMLREVYKYNSRITVNIDRLRKNPNSRGSEEEESIYKAFRETVYSFECQDYIRKIINTYVEKLEKK